MTIKEFEIEALDRWSGVITGFSGAGKTTMINTIPPGQKILIVSSENGLLAIREMLIERKKEVKAITIENFTDFQRCVETLQKSETESKYDWVVFDSLSEIGDQCLLHMNKKHGTNTWKRFEMLGEETIAILKTIRDMKSYFTLFTCLVKYEGGGDKGERTLLPQYPGNIVKYKLMSLFDEVLYIASRGKVDGTRVVYTDSLEGYPAKDRSGKLEYMESPDLGIITEKILGKSQG